MVAAAGSPALPGVGSHVAAAVGILVLPGVGSLQCPGVGTLAVAAVVCSQLGQRYKRGMRQAQHCC